MSVLKKIFFILVYIFAGIGLFFTLGYIAIKLHLTNTSGSIERTLHPQTQSETAQSAWQTSEEWQTLRPAILSDKAAILSAAQNIDISPRLVVAQLVVEQLRLYASNRELFKQVFKPLEILGVQSQYSWGVMGLKQETAISIEKNLTDRTSPFYLGQSYEHLLDFSTTDHDTERFERLTNDKDHSWAYLYTAIYLKEIETQWKKAGHDISKNPAVLSTLYNIGFAHSHPNAKPEVGGAQIDVNGATYTFGGLAGLFYDSNEITEAFPR